MVDVDDDRIRLDAILELNRWRKGRREEETRRALLAFWPNFSPKMSKSLPGSTYILTMAKIRSIKYSDL